MTGAGGNGFKPKDSRFRLDSRRKNFTVAVLEVLEQVVQRYCVAPSLEVLRTWLDGALSNLVKWKMSLPTAGWLGLGDL